MTQIIPTAASSFQSIGAGFSQQQACLAHCITEQHPADEPEEAEKKVVVVKGKKVF